MSRRATFELGGIRWWPRRGGGGPDLLDALRAALAALDAGAAENSKRGRRKELYRLALGPGHATTHLLKVNRYSVRDGLRRRLFTSKSRRELRLAEAIAERGVATPVPLAAGERRRGGRVRACYLLIPFLAGSRDLRCVAAGGLAPAERRALARGFGAFAARVHMAGVSQDDFQPNNFLVGAAGGEAGLWLVDCERVRLRARISERETAWQLAKLERELPQASLADRARFLSAYAGGTQAGCHEALARVAHALPLLVRRDAARLRRVVRARGRRFEPFAIGAWRGLHAAGFDVAQLQGLAARLDATAAPEAGLEPAGLHFLLRTEARTRSAAEAALAMALLLAHRGLAPRPVALLQRRSAVVLVFAGPLPVRLAELGPAARQAAAPALVALLSRLGALGRLDAVGAEHIGPAAPGSSVGLQLLDPTRFHAGGRASLPTRAAARAEALRILGARGAAD